MTKMRRTVRLVLLTLLLATLSACGDFEWFPEDKTATTTQNNTNQNSTTTTPQVNSKQMGGAIQIALSALSQSVTTIAGVLPGSADGTGAAARFKYPYDVAMDGANLYVADSDNNTIRKIVIATGEVTTLAGTAGGTGSADGTGTAARFNSPWGITATGGTLYVADAGNSTIRKIVIATGEVTTLAGLAGTAGTADGIGTAARFSSPKGLTTDGTSLYVAEFGSHTIRKIAIASGEVTTLAGTPGASGSADGIGAAARFNAPMGIAWTGGNLYVADSNNNTIRKVVIATGEVTTLAGTAGNVGLTDSTGAAARFNTPQGIATDGLNLYVADANNFAIRRIFIATGAVTTLAGSATYGSADGVGSAARFYFPAGVATDGTNVYVADAGNRTVRQVAIVTGYASTLAGCSPMGTDDGTGTAARFALPGGVATDGKNLYVADSYNNTVRKIVIATGAVTTLAGTKGVSGSADGTETEASFNYPRGITTDGTNLYVADTANNLIRKIVIDTAVVTTLAGGSSGSADGVGTAASFSSPRGITTDGTNLYVADTGNNTIRQIVIASGVVTTLAGSAGTTGSADGTGTAARFNFPMGVTTDGTSLYVADRQNSAIRKISISSGAVTTIAGTAGSSGTTDGTGTAARFDSPQGITTDGTNLYVGDFSIVRKIVIATGAVTTLAGQPGINGYADGTGAAAGFTHPAGLTTDGTSLYIADSDNSTIRKIQ